MAKKTKLIILAVSLLILLLAAMLCVEYFVLQSPVFDRSGWYTAENGAVQYRDYYANPLTGWVTIENEKYYFDPDGAMHTGWLEEGGKRYFLNGEGTLHTGWLEEDGQRCYLLAGVLQSGWLEQPEGTYLLDKEGQPLTGWVEQDGLRYYLNEQGIRNDCWQDTAEGLTYVTDGEKHTGWLDAPEGKFWFDQQGVAYTGWVTDETGRFYLYGDGTYATGFVEIDGVERYFLPTGEYVILCNRWNPIPDDYAMNLVPVGNYKMDATCAAAMEKMMADAEREGITLKINNTYRSKKTQQYMWETRRVKYMGQGMTLDEADAHIGRSVAVPGTSEHQTGLAVDIKGSQKVYDWLEENCWWRWSH